jgi:son of sevenless
MNNISSMNAIITALTSDSISPFDPTWDHISRRATLDALSKLSDPANDFAAYKAILKSVDGPCVPYIGMYLAEINHVRDRYPDTVRPNTKGTTTGPLINFTKRQRWSDIVEAMLRFQSKSYSYVEAPHTMGFIEGHFVIHDPNALWNKTLGQVETVSTTSRVISPVM